MLTFYFSDLIPLVDLGGIYSGSESALTQAATEIQEAFSTIGFVYLINHGIPETQVMNCFERASIGFVKMIFQKL